MKPFLLITPLLILLSACATTSDKKGMAPEEIKSRFENSRVIVQWVEKPVPLLERTKTKAVGNFIIASVAGSVVGIGASGNAQTNAQISQEFAVQLSQSLPSGDIINGSTGIDHIMVQKLADHFQDWHPKDTEHANDIIISVQALIWELGYLSLFDSDYGLNYQLRITAQEKQPQGEQALKILVCRGQAETKMPLEEWQAENYKAVNQVSLVIADTCLQQVMAEMGLQAVTQETPVHTP